jgi:isopentenyl-diphosphate delta-isomerase
MEKTYRMLADYDVPLRIANLGMPQFIRQKGKGAKKVYGVAEAKRALKMVDGHLLAIHMNYTQEVVQPEGDTNAKGAPAALKKIASKVPVLAKETGAGVSKATAVRLKKAGVKGIDVGGMGGTSFSAVEVYRAKAKKDTIRRRVGETFWDWGIPTPVSIMEASSTGLPVIGTGGVRDGIDAGKAIALGASAAGMAYNVLGPASRSYKAVRASLEVVVEELRAAVFLTGGVKTASLAKAGVRIGGGLGHWL